MSTNHTQQNAFGPIAEGPIVLDFSHCQYPGEIHLILKEKFGLPDDYGENWDALWDCLDALFETDERFQVHICGFSALSAQLREHCAAMLEVFEDIHRDHPNVTFIRIS